MLHAMVVAILHSNIGSEVGECEFSCLKVFQIKGQVMIP